MSGAIINSGSDENCVVIETTQGKSQITVQQYQHIYSLITGKSEQVTKDSKKNIKAKLEDFRHLDIKIKQLLEQYKIIGSSSTYAIYYDNDQKEVSETFERFALTAAAPNNITTNVVFTYKFSILLPFVNQAQNYSLQINVNNRCAIHKKMRAEMPADAPRRIFSFLAADTVELKLEYIDYAVTRTILSAFDEWVASLDESSQHPALSFAKKHSSSIPIFFKYFTLIFLVWGLTGSAQEHLGNVKTFWQFFQISTILAFISYITINIAIAFGRRIEKAIDSIEPPSYIKITRGDERTAEEADNSNKGELIKAAVTGTISATFGVITKYIAGLIGLLFHTPL